MGLVFPYSEVELINLSQIKDVPEAVKQIGEAISCVDYAMHNREIHFAAEVAQKYLGRDTLAEQRAVDYSKLPEREKNQMAKAGSFGIYGVFHLVSRPEVAAALSVFGRHLTKSFEISACNLERLADPKIVESVVTRFPAITREDIQRALTNS